MGKIKLKRFGYEFSITAEKEDLNGEEKKHSKRTVSLQFYMRKFEAENDSKCFRLDKHVALVSTFVTLIGIFAGLWQILY